MKISLITIHVGNNFGSVLQTIATCKLFEDLGYNVTVVNYRPDRVTFKNYIIGAFSSVPKFVWRIIFLPIYFKNRHIYNSYLNKYCHLSKPIYSNQTFSELCPHADVYVTGSDQVWNSKHNQGIDNRYFFAGVKGPKIALSSSIGRTDVDENEKALFYKFLSHYTAISVREESAVKLLESIGLSCTQLLDPTLLISKEEWGNYMSPRIVKGRYVLLYLPYNIINKQIIIESAKKLAHDMDLKIVSFSWTIKNESYADKTIKFANPGDFLSLFYYADYVITNSFHGTAFSINLNKQFYVFQPSEFSTRIDSILNLTHLKNRLLINVLGDDNLTLVEYDDVNAILESERNRCMDFLKTALQRCI